MLNVVDKLREIDIISSYAGEYAGELSIKLNIDILSQFVLQQAGMFCVG